MKHVLLAALICLPAVALGFERRCDAEDGCAIEGPAPGTYHIAVPDGWTPEPTVPQKVLVFFHGHGGSGRATIRGSGMVRRFTEAGYVILAPDAAAIPGRTVRGWPARPGVDGGRDDVAFAEAVIDDATARLGLGGTDILMAGFSAGGSMAWMFACYSDMPLGAVVSVAGGLRRPNPEHACPAGPRRLLQIHGYADRQVPLEGRGIGTWHQGDVFESLSLLRTTNGCQSLPDTVTIDDTTWCRDWNGCASGSAIRMCLHPGGHGMPPGWVQRAMDWHRPPQD